MGHHPVEDSNRSDNTTINTVLEQHLSRRQILRGGATAATMVAGASLVACGGDSNNRGNGGDAGGQVPTELGFAAVPRSLEDRVVLPEGYRASVLIAKGDALFSDIADYQNDGSGEDFDKRSGDEHDGMEYFGLGADGAWDPNASERGVLCMNHENLEDDTLHENGVTAAADNGGARPQVEIDREILAHGVACLEVVKEDGQWRYVKDSAFNRRVAGATEAVISGPCAGHDALKTKLSPAGDKGFGTLNNCASGRTPWGTYLTCEENWFSYFNRNDASDARSATENDLFARYGMGLVSKGFSYREWDTVAGDMYQRFNISVTGASATEDFRNEPNTFGYIVEVDPFDTASKPVKRTAMGRFAHEGAIFAPAEAGKPLVYYMGDDSRNEYLYKFVSAANWDPADVGTGTAAGNKYLDDGKLYVAVFNNDGTGEWKELSVGVNGLDAMNPLYPFSSQGDVMLATRLAADHVGATKMDRPEWAAVNPINGECYLTLTNNRGSNRNPDTVDGPNPRTYGGSGGNPNGHIIRWREEGGDHSATRFDWDVFLFGSPADKDAQSINLSGLTADNDFSSPDGLYFDHRGLLWIQTDDGAYRDTVNNQMLVAIPGEVGDGGMLTFTNDFGGEENTTFVGKDASAVDLRRFLVGPKGCEITGITMTPDGRSLFINVQHPGEGGSAANFNTDVSTWPNPNGDALALGNGVSRPRSATIVITREDNGEIAV